LPIARFNALYVFDAFGKGITKLGLAPIGMMECWNIGKMGLGILQYSVNGPPKAEQ